jgi:hypothetical protein
MEIENTIGQNEKEEPQEAKTEIETTTHSEQKKKVNLMKSGCFLDLMKTHSKTITE